MKIVTIHKYNYGTVYQHLNDGTTNYLSSSSTVIYYVQSATQAIAVQAPSVSNVPITGSNAANLGANIQARFPSATTFIMMAPENFLDPTQFIADPGTLNAVGLGITGATSLYHTGVLWALWRTTNTADSYVNQNYPVSPSLYAYVANQIVALFPSFLGANNGASPGTVLTNAAFDADIINPNSPTSVTNLANASSTLQRYTPDGFAINKIGSYLNAGAVGTPSVTYNNNYPTYKRQEALNFFSGALNWTLTTTLNFTSSYTGDINIGDSAYFNNNGNALFGGTGLAFTLQIANTTGMGFVGIRSFGSYTSAGNNTSLGGSLTTGASVTISLNLNGGSIGKVAFGSAAASNSNLAFGTNGGNVTITLNSIKEIAPFSFSSGAYDDGTIPPGTPSTSFPINAPWAGFSGSGKTVSIDIEQTTTAAQRPGFAVNRLYSSDRVLVYAHITRRQQQHGCGNVALQSRWSTLSDQGIRFISRPGNYCSNYCGQPRFD